MKNIHTSLAIKMKGMEIEYIQKFIGFNRDVISTQLIPSQNTRKTKKFLANKLDNFSFWDQKFFFETISRTKVVLFFNIFFFLMKNYAKIITNGNTL